MIILHPEDAAMDPPFEAKIEELLPLLMLEGVLDEMMELFPPVDEMEVVVEARTAELFALAPRVLPEPATMLLFAVSSMLFVKVPQISIHFISPSLLLLQRMKPKSEFNCREPPPSP